MLELRNINKTYKPKKGVPVKALKNINLSFQEKGMVFILGKSGCGKSTLLNVIGGLDKFDSGEIIIKGKSSKEFSGSDFDSYRNTFLGFIFQEYNILSEFNVEKNIALALELQGKKATEENVNNLLEKVDLKDQGKRKTNELSGGQKQRIAIARALIKDPEIIIADEPTGALDSATGKQVFETLKNLSKDKLVIIVSHDREFAEIYADRIIEMKDGVVISDETKRKVDAVKLNEDVSVVGNDILHIKCGHQLTGKELEAIGNFISKQKTDTIISVGEKNNKKFKEIAKIDDSGRSERFDDTKEEDLNLKQYDKKQLKLIRSRLKLKDSFKMGASGLKSKPIRLAVAIFLAFIAFSMFGLVDTLGSFKYLSTTTQSIVDSGVNSLSFNKKEVYDQDAEYKWFIETQMTKQDIDGLSETLGLNFKPVYSTKSGSGSFDLGNNIYSVKQDEYHSTTPAGFVEFKEEDFPALGYSLVAGRYPQAIEEIVITKYTYELFEQGGYRSNSSNINIKANELTIDNFLSSAYIEFGNRSLKVVGILDTKIEKERYKMFWDQQTAQNASFLELSLLNQELTQVKSYSYHNLIYGYTGLFELLKGENEYVPEIGFDIALVDYNRYFLYFGDQYIRDYNCLTTYSQANNYSKMDLVLAEGKTIGNVNGVENIAIKASDVSAIMAQVRGDYKNIPVPEIGSRSITNYDNNDELSIAMYIIEYLELQGVSDTLKTNAVTTVLNYLKTNYEPQFSSYIRNKQTDRLAFEIVGLYLTTNDVSSFNWLIVGDEYYEGIKSVAKLDAIYSFAITTMPSDLDKVRTAVDYHYQNLQVCENDDPQTNIVYLMSNEVTSTMDAVYGFISQISQIFLYIGIGLCVFASLLLMNFISTSISYKKREIGILRALGSRKSDVFGIFFNESLIIAFINFVLATITSIAVTIILNGVLRNNYGLKITLLNFGIRQIGLLLAVSVLVAFLSSFLPVMNIAKKQPIDAINNR